MKRMDGPGRSSGPVHGADDSQWDEKSTAQHRLRGDAVLFRDGAGRVRAIALFGAPFCWPGLEDCEGIFNVDFAAPILRAGKSSRYSDGWRRRASPMPCCFWPFCIRILRNARGARPGQQLLVCIGDQALVNGPLQVQIVAVVARLPIALRRAAAAALRRAAGHESDDWDFSYCCGLCLCGPRNCFILQEV